MIRKLILIALPLVIVTGIGVWLLLRHEVHRETKESPCGKYRADFYTFLYSNLLPGPPGGGSDRPGRVYIRRNPDGKTLLRADLPMIQQSSDLT